MRDGDGGRNAGDQFGGGLFQPLEELPRVGRKRFDVPPLAFGIQRVEGEARLAAAAQAAENDELAVRNVEIDPLEVMHLDAAQSDKSLAVAHVSSSQLFSQ